MSRLCLALLLGMLACAQPHVSGTIPKTQAAQGSLDEIVRSVGTSAKATWLAYSVAGVPREQSNCWHSSRDGNPSAARSNYPIRLEQTGEFFVALRLLNGAVTKLRTFSADCEIDSTNADFVYLTGVTAASSLEYLRKNISEPAVAAIALHATPEADNLLEGFTSAAQPEWLRRKALFWLGVERGKRGFEIIVKTLQDEGSGRIREGAVQALAMSREPAAVNTLLAMARNEADPKVRGTALFWIAQKAGKLAIGTIQSAIENDPEIQVKEKAVFALSQLPPDQGVPLLIDTARNNKTAAVRKKAMFWLGQSSDPRALKFFEEVLAR